MFIAVGDLGGYMGLLLGASVVTLFELLDFIMYSILKKVSKNYGNAMNQETTGIL